MYIPFCVSPGPLGSVLALDARRRSFSLLRLRILLSGRILGKQSDIVVAELLGGSSHMLNLVNGLGVGGQRWKPISGGPGCCGI